MLPADERTCLFLHRADDARLYLAAVERNLTPEQIAEGQRLAREFRPGKASSPSESPASPSRAGANTGFVNVSAADDACEVFVDGAFVGNTPAKVKLPAGAHLVEVRKPGFKDYQRQLQVSEGSELNLRAVLEKK